MYFNPNRIVNSLLCCNNLKFPMYKNHYVTGKDIWLFSNLACIENTLSNFTCNLKSNINNCKQCFRK